MHSPAFHPSRRSSGIRLLLPAVAIVAIIATAGIALFFSTNSSMQEKIKQELQTAAVLAARHIDTTQLNKIHSEKDMNSAAFKAVAKELNDIKHAVPHARFVYIFRKTNDVSNVKFVVDADTLLTNEELDVNHDGEVDTDEVAALPGEDYDVSEQPELQGPAFEEPLVTDVYTDQWGPLLTAFAPIESKDNTYTLGIDINAQEFVRLSQSAFSPSALLLIILLGVLMAGIAMSYVWQRKVTEERRVAGVRSNVVRLAMHQLGAPIATMQWWLSILKEKEGAMDAGKQEAFGTIEDSIKRVQELLSALQRATSAADKTMDAVEGVTSIAEIIEDIQADTAQELKSKNQKLVTDVESCRKVRLSPAFVSGVVQELVENAIAYSPNGKTISITARCDEQTAKISVKDEGYGIDATELPNLFTEFQRGKEAQKYKPVGNGLGLFVAKNIVEAGGGQIWIESEKGKGTTVTFTLPCV